MMNSLSRFADPVYCIMRLIVGLLFASHGGQKLLGFPPGGHGAGAGIMYVGGWIELVCGLLIAIGLLTRVAAFIASGEMAVAYFRAHAQGGFFPIINHGEAAVFYCFVFLFIFFYGPGRWSVDALIWNRKAAPPATA
jgi:putative oxidoreductase